MERDELFILAVTDLERVHGGLGVLQTIALFVDDAVKDGFSSDEILFSLREKSEKFRCRLEKDLEKFDKRVMEFCEEEPLKEDTEDGC